MRIQLGILATVFVLSAPPAITVEPTGHWPSFRGEQARGVAEGHSTPVAWDLDSGDNILWKTPIPGMGLGAPVVWGDRAYVLTAVGPDKDPSLKVGLYGNIGAAADMGPQE